MSSTLRNMITEQKRRSMSESSTIASMLKAISEATLQLAESASSASDLTRVREQLEEICESLDINLSENSDYETAKKRVSKIKKGTNVSFTDPDGKRHTGPYQGMMNRGGRSYAKVDLKDRLAVVPVTHIQ